ncbi:hypothetical protein U1Q18_034178 [Sarracenia purpurea var. burkii]
MPPPANVASPSDRVPTGPIITPAQPAPMIMMPEPFAKDALIAWFRGEFAAANAIIDALCNHLTQLEGGGGSEYESVFASLYRRRLNWMPILQMQKYCSIADVALELRRVATKKMVESKERGNMIRNEELNVSSNEQEKSPEVPEDESTESTENGGGEVVDKESTRDDSPESGITDTGSQEVQPTSENAELCCNHEDCDARRALIKITKGFVAKEPVKGHMVNVVRGLKLYEDIFTDSELSKLKHFANELRVAGQNGELPGHIEPIHTLLQRVIDHLIQWHLISEDRKPNSCIINFFDEGEYSQPFQKPPHLDQPISTLLLSESTMAFGQTLVSDSDGNYKGPLMLSLKEGSLLVMRGNSSDTARHMICPSPSKRVSITFFRIRPEDKNHQNNINKSSSATHSRTRTNVSLRDPATMNCHVSMNGFPKWGLLRAPVVMLAPSHPMVLSPRRMIQCGGTGVFLPWTLGSRKPVKHLPPRAQKGRLPLLPSTVETHISDSI